MTAVWDISVRVVHWAMVVLIGFSWYAAENYLMDWHRWSGYAVLALLVFRLAWGIFGSSTARFSQFVKGPDAIGSYLRTLPRRAPGNTIGHNPIGALSVIALLVILLVQVVTGLFAVDIDGIESGPLSYLTSFDQGRWLAELHHASFTVLQILIVFHIFAIIFYLVWKRDNLITPMITGVRNGSRNGLARATPTRLIIAILLAAAVVWPIAAGWQN